MVDYAATPTEFRAGRVVSRSFSTLFRNFAPFCLLALVISAPTYVYTILAGPGNLAMSTEPMVYWSQLGARPLVVFIVNFLLGYLIIAALVYGTIQDLRQERASLGECFSRGVALMFPAVGVAVVMILVLALVAVVTVFPGALIIGVLFAGTGSTALGLLTVLLIAALFIPTVYVWIMLWVTIPVAVIERRGLGSLRRSMVLTKGSRWRIFFLVLLLLVIGIGIGLLLSLVGSTMTAVELSGGGAMSSANFTAQVAIQWIVSAFVNALGAVLAAVTYHDLRVAKEGVDASQIAAVFD